MPSGGHYVLRRWGFSRVCLCWDDAALVNRSWKHPHGLTQAGSLIKYQVPRSSQLVVVECVRRALDGLSPLSGPSGA